MVTAGDDRVKQQGDLVEQHKWQEGQLEKEVVTWKVKSASAKNKLEELEIVTANQARQLEASQQKYGE